MTLMTRQEVMDEIVRPYMAAVNADMEALRNNPTSEVMKAWRRCLRKGRPPVYRYTAEGLTGDTLGFVVELTPPDGWVP